MTWDGKAAGCSPLQQSVDQEIQHIRFVTHAGYGHNMESRTIARAAKASLKAGSDECESLFPVAGKAVAVSRGAELHVIGVGRKAQMSALEAAIIAEPVSLLAQSILEVFFADKQSMTAPPGSSSEMELIGW